MPITLDNVEPLIDYEVRLFEHHDQTAHNQGLDLELFGVANTKYQEQNYLWVYMRLLNTDDHTYQQLALKGQDVQALIDALKRKLSSMQQIDRLAQQRRELRDAQQGEETEGTEELIDTVAT